MRRLKMIITGEGALESYENVSQFCQEHGFELIELAPLPEHVAGSENANEESARYESEDEFGPKRILNALLVNPWTGMNRKKWKPPGKAGESKTEGEGEAEKKEGEAAGDAAAVAEKNETEALVDACAAQMSTAFSSDSGKSGAASGSSGNASTSDSSMDDLLTKLKQVKARTAKLSDDDRKKYAERVAMSFANAMGVDD